jgi:biopolymer transport protein ExbD
MAGGTSHFEDDDSGRMITDINVTPLVDIVLVMLIIFMVTTSYIVNPSIKVDLPKAATGSDQAKTTLGLTITKDGTLFLNGEKTDDAGVTRFIAAELPRNPDLQAVIAGDKAVAHGSVVHVIDVVKKAGIKKFAINVETGP